MTGREREYKSKLSLLGMLPPADDECTKHSRYVPIKLLQTAANKAVQFLDQSVQAGLM